MKTRILIIDDEEMVRETIGKLLERYGYDVTVAADGDEGERMFREHPADLVILDILMPRRDGLDLLACLKKIAPDLPVIAISGGGKTGKLDLLPAARHLGAALTFVKPFNPHILTDAIAQLLSKEVQQEIRVDIGEL
jgi:DNA-binding NtrC family response regulator